ncbi:MAG: response regulator transcription factor [Xanthobacteraceae bacterium]|nr:response regulator transcription factor [Xanthobacteraceae bacterium]
MRVLVVEDDPQLGRWLRETFMASFGEADLVTSLEESRAAVAVRQFDLVVIDRGLPDGEGADLLADLRRQQPTPAILMLTALDDPTSVAQALNRGADDYISKPFAPVELVARARAVLRRVLLDKGAVVSIANLDYDVINRAVYIDQKPILVPRRELAILEAMVRRAGRVVERNTLEIATYGFDDEIQSNAIDAHISRLRRRLREANCRVTIRPIRGLGYLLNDE